MRSHSKSHARKLTFQFLYSKDIISLKTLSQEELFAEFNTFDTGYADLESIPASKKHEKRGSLTFGKGLICSFVINYDKVVEKLRCFCDRGNFDNLSNIEKILLIMGGTEILFREDIPNIVAINEYVNLAKEFGNEKTAPFINGVLDQLTKEAPP